MSKHTPGPWDNLGPIIHVRGQHIAHVLVDPLPDSDERGTPEQRANAYLIASSPELLEACEELIDRLDIVRLRGYIGHPLVDKVKQAIRKAKGETT